MVEELIAEEEHPPEALEPPPPAADCGDSDGGSASRTSTARRLRLRLALPSSPQLDSEAATNAAGSAAGDGGSAAPAGRAAREISSPAETGVPCHCCPNLFTRAGAMESSSGQEEAWCLSQVASSPLR